MKKYLSFFRIRFTTGIQYRAAALAGIVTQFFWGAMAILMYHAFYRTNSQAFPMTFSGVVCYVWLNQAFFSLFNPWAFENEIFEMIKTGNVAYEFCRPLDLYGQWFAKGAATRVSRVVLRCAPILVTAFFLPEPYGLVLPESFAAFWQFLLALVLGFLVMVAFSTAVYVTCFFTISPDGVRIVAASVTEFLSGSVVPLPFFPDPIRKIAQVLPFASMQNVPFRIYGGDLCGREAWQMLLMQGIWLILLVALGKLLMMLASRRIVVQGG